MRNLLMKKRIAALLSATVMSVTGIAGAAGTAMTAVLTAGVTTSFAAESSVKVLTSVGYGEGMYATWSPVTGADGYNVYVDGTQIDSMLIRQYSGYFRADMVGLKAGSHTMTIVPVTGGKEDTSKQAETKADVYAHDRSGFGFVNGSSSGAYNDDGTLKANATVVYVTNDTKDSVSVTLPDKKGNDVELKGVQAIITGLKSNEKCGPVDIRFIGNITDPDGMSKGDLYVDAVTCGLTIEGIGNDTTFNGFGLVMKNSSNVEARNIGFMNCDSSEGDDCGLQQKNDHIWVHNCDFFYGDAGSDADQVKGDGALDTKTSTYITHSYNHFWDNGKCNLQGMKSESTENYITYHHNWYDHSDSRHPRIRTCTVHTYNNYFDGNAKYGVGVTMGSSCFVENNYFRNCKYPMLASMQGSDIAEGEGTFSGEDGGIIKSYGNYIEGEKAYVTYQDNDTEFDAYEASSRDEQVPSSVKTKQGGTGYNNFDTAGDFYSYTPDKAEDVPAVVTAKAGRVDGGDFQWKFDNSVDDASYAVNQGLKDAIVAYDDSIVAIGSGFKEDSGTVTPPTTTAPVQTNTPATQTTATPTKPTPPATTPTPVTGDNVIYASPDGKGDGKTKDTPTDVLTAIGSVKAGGTIYLLGGTYKFSEMIMIDSSNSGTEGNYKTISAYPGDKVVWDFSGQGAADGSKRGVTLDGDYWHFYGFEITKAADNGMLLSGNNNKIEMMVFNDNQDTGLQVSRYNTSAASIADWPSYNLILNCTSKNNCDDATMENADGFAAKLTCGEGNVFDGCMAYCNSDDGWDLFAKSETGPIGVVTIKNSIAFRNGFTEFGEGYGDCDGNGFKLGGSGVGSAHVVVNCLAFENLNCGFTDNNNPKLGSLTDCTAYNNGVGGNGKPNVSCYRCTDTTTLFTDVMSYISTGKVSDVGAAGIKVSNDKLVGKAENTVYYNSKYYYAKSETMTNGAKVGDIITPADSDFISLSVPAMGTDFHTAWRNADGSPNPAGFAETASNGTYASVGYHMSNGSSSVTPPATTPTTPISPSKPDETKTTASTKAPEVNPTPAGGYVHDFTANGKNSTFYTITGNLSTSKGTVNYAGKELTQALKMESSTSIDFTADKDGTLTLVFDKGGAVKVDGEKYTADASGIAAIELKAGAHKITKGDSLNMFYMVYSESGSSQGGDTPTTPTTPTEKPTTPTTPSENAGYGDANLDGNVTIADSVAILQYLANPDEYGLKGDALTNADCCNVGDGVNTDDALAIQKLDAGVITSLPETK